MRVKTILIAVAVILVVMPATMRAGDAEDQKVLRVQRMLRQVSHERDVLQEENAKLKGGIEELNRKHTGVKKSSDAALAKSRESIAALNADLQQALQTLRQFEADKQGLEALTAQQSESLEICKSNNVKLVGANRELLDRYKNKGVFDALLQREPLTGLKRVEIESLVEEYRDRLDGLQLRTGPLNTAAEADAKSN